MFNRFRSFWSVLKDFLSIFKSLLEESIFHFSGLLSIFSKAKVITASFLYSSFLVQKMRFLRTLLGKGSPRIEFDFEKENLRAFVPAIQ